MTVRAPATKAQIVRAIAAARAAGLTVRGIRPDGIVIVDDAVDLAPALPSDRPASKWGDAPP